MASNRRSLLKGITLGGAGAAIPGALASLATSASAQAQPAALLPADKLRKLRMFPMRVPAWSRWSAHHAEDRAALRKCH